jgi:hypothetical protein
MRHNKNNGLHCESKYESANKDICLCIKFEIGCFNFKVKNEKFGRSGRWQTLDFVHGSWRSMTVFFMFPSSFILCISVSAKYSHIIRGIYCSRLRHQCSLRNWYHFGATNEKKKSVKYKIFKLMTQRVWSALLIGALIPPASIGMHGDHSPIDLENAY